MERRGAQTVREMFSARRPKFMPDKRIKQVATSTIITNKIRSPLNESLKFDVVNIGFRGNEGNRFTSKKFELSVENNAVLYTSVRSCVPHPHSRCRRKAASGWKWREHAAACTSRIRVVYR
jgi:hypothetical protein